jgi:hypothetical protein
MKRFAWLSCLLLFSFILLSTGAQAQKKRPSASSQAVNTSLKDLIGIFWFPLTERQNSQPRKGFMFESEQGLRGYDGCNSFWADCSYKPKEGFRVTNLTHTLLDCREDRKSFSVGFLGSATNFVRKADELIFYDENNK